MVNIKFHLNEAFAEIEKGRQRDIQRLLYLIYAFLKYCGVSTGDLSKCWLKEHALKALIYYGIIKGVFETYDYSPRLLIWGSLTRFINISSEAERDLVSLIEKGLLKRLRLATPTYRYIYAYSLNEDHLKRELNVIPESIKNQVHDLLRCPKCGRMDKVIIEFESIGDIEEDIFPFLYCMRCHLRIDTYGVKDKRNAMNGILSPEDVDYDSEPVKL